MKHNMTISQYLTVASMLFGLFFGAGNLIFPVSMGQLSGSHVWQAIAGFLITGVGLPLFGVTALGISRCSGLAQLSRRVGRRYGTAFTCALYLTIGPFFAIPRCATVPFTVGIEPMLAQSAPLSVYLGLFSFLFFAIVLWFSLRPSGILTWIGKILNPAFLLFLGILIATAMLRPLGSVADIAPSSAYVQGAFFNGFLEGYNTMDALAGLAFGIIVVNVIRDLGVNEPGDVARCTLKAGLISALLMAVIYILVTVIGTQSRGVFDAAENGGTALAQIARHYYGPFGSLILAVTVTFACLKTSIGLITSCSETFAAMFPKLLNYKKWAVIFSTVSFLLANLGLSAIIQFSLPVLMFLYPLAITLIFLGLTGPFFQNSSVVYLSTTIGALAAASIDFLKALPPIVREHFRLEGILTAADRFLPMFTKGLGWLLPAFFGFLIGLALYCRKRRV